MESNTFYGDFIAKLVWFLWRKHCKSNDHGIVVLILPSNRHKNYHFPYCCNTILTGMISRDIIQTELPSITRPLGASLF